MSGHDAGETILTADVVIVGGGAAGMAAALGCGDLDVVMLAKGAVGSDGSSAMAQGGIAAALGDGDSAALHARDTVAVAGGVAERAAVELLTATAADWIEELEALGAGFDRGSDGDIALGREAAHTAARVVHARGDQTGRYLSRALGRAVSGRPNVRLESGLIARDLIVRSGRVVGVRASRPEGGSVALLARAVVLATGGIGQLYLDTTNPQGSTGDGLAMAARAGATLADLEFVQFHPTALAVDEDPRPLLTEALRGAGAHLIDDAGDRFMEKIDPRGELAPRDIVARAIAQRVAADRRVWLDARRVAPQDFPGRFPTVFELTRRHGLDPRRDLLPVRPAAHYHMGGVLTDTRGRTSLAGLWAAGEVACTGVHGANRLASNSLLECLVFGGRAADDLVSNLPTRPTPLIEASVEQSEIRRSRDPLLEHGVRRVMSDWLGVLRDTRGLARARAQLGAMASTIARAHPTTRNQWTVAALITAAAAHRRESRGSHYRVDHPARSRSGAFRITARMDRQDPLTPILEVLRAPHEFAGEVAQ